VGGELLTIEASAIPGKGRVIKTGSLGDVMQESIQAALTVVRSRAMALGIRKTSTRKMTCIFMFPRVQRQKTDHRPVLACAPLWCQF